FNLLLLNFKLLVTFVMIFPCLFCCQFEENCARSHVLQIFHRFAKLTLADTSNPNSNSSSTSSAYSKGKGKGSASSSSSTSIWSLPNDHFLSVDCDQLDLILRDFQYLCSKAEMARDF